MGPLAPATAALQAVLALWLDAAQLRLLDLSAAGGAAGSADRLVEAALAAVAAVADTNDAADVATHLSEPLSGEDDAV